MLYLKTTFAIFSLRGPHNGPQELNVSAYVLILSAFVDFLNFSVQRECLGMND